MISKIPTQLVTIRHVNILLVHARIVNITHAGLALQELQALPELRAQQGLQVLPAQQALQEQPAQLVLPV